MLIRYGWKKFVIDNDKTWRTASHAWEKSQQDRAEYIPRKHGNMINQNEVIWTRRKGVTKAQNVASYAWR